jgi:hypothetical protein
VPVTTVSSLRRGRLGALSEECYSWTQKAEELSTGHVGGAQREQLMDAVQSHPGQNLWLSSLAHISCFWGAL